MVHAFSLQTALGKGNRKRDVPAEEYARNPASSKCMDVAVAVKSGAREVWDGIKAHKIETMHSPVEMPSCPGKCCSISGGEKFAMYDATSHDQASDP